VSLMCKSIFSIGNNILGRSVSVELQL